MVLRCEFFVLSILSIDIKTMIQGSSSQTLICLLLFIELDKVFLGIYVIICVINCTVFKSAIVHTTCIDLKIFCSIFACVCYCVHFEYLFIIAVFNISSGMNSVSGTCKLSYFMIIKLLVCNSIASLPTEF